MCKVHPCLMRKRFPADWAQAEILKQYLCNYCWYNIKRVVWRAKGPGRLVKRPAATMSVCPRSRWMERKSNGLGSGFVMVSSVLLRILASSMCTFITHTCEFDWFSLLFSTQLPSPV